MRKQTVAFSKESANLFFHILTQCNLRCAHCYINRAQHGNITLDIGTIENWLALFAKDAPKTNLIFLGGEPTLHPDLASAVKTARTMGFQSITIDTNGYLFHNILDKITPEDVDFISFSLDGATKETNDAIRGKGCWDKVMQGVEQAKAKGFSCSMIYTVSEKNIQELDRMPDLIKGLGLDRFFIQVVGIRGESKITDARHQVNKSTWLTTIPAVAEKIAKTGITVTYPKVFLDTADTFQCAGNVARNHFIFPNGRVYQCPICEDFPLHSWEIVENRLVDQPKINETDLFALDIPEGCVMNKMIQPGNLAYDGQGNPCHKIACCMLKEEIIA
ncbi:MAG: heme biosynthesis protein [Deltaproteobacteria bacterium]|nr:MAG: heme biosynthesis protein [Deltaproteobacteria bacterium]